MINDKQLWRDFSELPPGAQAIVLEFINFLHEKYAASPPASAKHDEAIHGDSFVGMWADRNDMADSSKWVRDVRQYEWRDVQS